MFIMNYNYRRQERVEREQWLKANKKDDAAKVAVAAENPDDDDDEESQILKMASKSLKRMVSKEESKSRLQPAAGKFYTITIELIFDWYSII